MSTTEITTKVEHIKTLQTMIDEMTARGVEEMTVSCFKVRYKEVSSNRFDSTEFKKTHSELYEQYCKKTVSKRFSIA